MKNSKIKIKLTYLAILFLVLNTKTTSAQICGSDEYWKQRVVKIPSLESKRLESEADLASYRKAAYKTLSDTGTLTIPVVFHIITSSKYPVNSTLSKCRNQISILNHDYTATNNDTSDIRPVFKSRLGDAHINFILATKDPEGKPFSGMTFDTSILTYNASDSVKAVVDWDNRFYLNVWVVYNISTFGAPGVDIAGYSTFPWDRAINSRKDGIVLDHSFLGVDRTLTHEIGHYLGLYHTFQDGCNGGDKVDDTPPVLEANLGKCNSWPTKDTSLNSCHNDIPDLPDMLENFMDYATCKVMFTKGQVDRMRYYLTLNRVSLYNNNNVAGIRNDEFTQASLAIYPNPANTSFTMEASGLAAGKTVQIKCFDIMGRLHLEEVVAINNDGDMIHQMDANGLTPGVYQVMIFQGNEMKAVKALVKE